MTFESETTETLPGWSPSQTNPDGPAAKLYQIQYTSKAGRYDPHERILGVGGLGRHGALWMLSQEEAVTAIESGRLGFYIEAGGRRQRVVVAVSESGLRYLKTETDGAQPNHLLDLPECRWEIDLRAPAASLRC